MTQFSSPHTSAQIVMHRMMMMITTRDTYIYIRTYVSSPHTSAQIVTHMMMMIITTCECLTTHEFLTAMIYFDKMRTLAGVPLRFHFLMEGYVQ